MNTRAPTQGADLGPTLQRLSTHLDMLAGQVFEVEQALGLVLSEKDASKSVPITKLQSLDYTRQCLEDCALLLHFLSAKTSEQPFVEIEWARISNRLKLDATRGLLTDETIEKSIRGNGDLDLF